jgi:hypothetical protein
MSPIFRKLPTATGTERHVSLAAGVTKDLDFWMPSNGTVNPAEHL